MMRISRTVARVATMSIGNDNHLSLVRWYCTHSQQMRRTDGATSEPVFVLTSYDRYGPLPQFAKAPRCRHNLRSAPFRILCHCDCRNEPGPHSSRGLYPTLFASIMYNISQNCDYVREAVRHKMRPSQSCHREGIWQSPLVLTKRGYSTDCVVWFGCQVCGL